MNQQAPKSVVSESAEGSGTMVISFTATLTPDVKPFLGGRKREDEKSKQQDEPRIHLPSELASAKPLKRQSRRVTRSSRRDLRGELNCRCPRRLGHEKPEGAGCKHFFRSRGRGIKTDVPETSQRTRASAPS